MFVSVKHFVGDADAQHHATCATSATLYRMNPDERIPKEK